MNKKNAGVEAVDKALQILNAFREKREELTLTEISKQINQYKSTTSRLCTSLLKFGYIERLPSKKYKLGNAINRLINVYDETFHINDLIQKKNKKKKIIIYGENSSDNSIVKKYYQLQKLGINNIFIYMGGLFEWLLLQDIYGNDQFPTTTEIIDILKYKGSILETLRDI